MAGGVPRQLAALLEATDSRARDGAWSAFLDRYSDLILKTARSFGGDYDAAMDRYRYVLDALREDDLKRLRSYAVKGRSTFESWLVVVVRRLCLDFARLRYGRPRPGESRDAEEQRALRRRLKDLAGMELKAELVAPPTAPDPDRRLREAELSAALDAALAELPPRDRLLLQLRYEDERSVREVAEVLDFPSVFHVYRRLKKVLGRLRRLLVSAGVEDSAP